MDKDLVINKYEVALFPKDFSISDSNSLLQKLEQIDVFTGGMNTLIPVPNDAPREIPRILLRSKNTLVSCDVSLNKINIIWPNIKRGTNFNIPLTDIQNLTEKLFNVLSPAGKIKRVGYIKEFFYEYGAGDPIRSVKGKIVCDEITKELRDFFLRFTYNLKLKRHQNCNKVISIISSSGKKHTEEKEVIMLMDDINTSQHDDVNWGIEEIKNFIKEADEKIDKSKLMKQFFNQNDSS